MSKDFPNLTNHTEDNRALLTRRQTLPALAVSIGAGFVGAGRLSAESAMCFIETEQVLITAPRLLETAKIFLKVEGQASGRISVDGGDMSGATERYAFSNGAEKQAVLSH
jgi:hypothetical protein